MADPFVAEIRIFPFNFAPRGWAFCNGQILPISQNTALFSLLGTTYGGNGQSTFALPDMQGNAPMHPGQGPGLSLHDLGETSGSETVTLLTSEMPAHSHGLLGLGAPGNRTNPIGNTFARLPSGMAYIPGSPAPPLTNLSDQTLPPAGGNLPHNNMMPYLTLNFNIALQGVFPPRT
jgi:microcystin-dependent protein